MAYSGLGAGTQADPYQITTVAQFNEMNSSSYTGIYFLLMNDLDCTNQSINISNFYCKLDGGAHSLNNLSINSTLFYLANSSSITNIKINYVDSADTISGLYIFGYATSVTLASISLTNITITNNIIRQGYSQRLVNGNFASTCTLSNIIIDGCFDRLFNTVACSINTISVLNTYRGHCPLIWSTIKSTSIIENFQYHKPITYSSTAENIYLIVNSITSGCKIRNGFIKVGKVSTSGSFSFIGYTLDSASGTYTIENIGLIASSILAEASDRNWLIHGYNQALTGTGNSFKNIYFDGDFNTPNQLTRTELMDYSHKATACYYNSDALTSMTDVNYAGQTGLTASQFLISSNFSNWDFSTVWQMGTSKPELINVPTYTAFINSPYNAYLFTPTRKSSNGYSNTIGMQILRNSGSNFGTEIYDPNNNLVDVETEDDAFDFNLLDVDRVYTIKFYSYVNAVKTYTTSIQYTHYVYDSAINTTTIVCESTTTIDNGTNKGNLLHGSLLYNNTLYGSTRNVQSGSPTVNGCIFKAPSSDVSNYTLIPIYLSEANLKSCNMDSLVEIGGFLYTIATSSFTDGTLYLIKFNPSTNDYQVYRIAGTAANGAPSCTDGVYLYVYVNWYTSSNPSIVKINPSVFNSETKFNVSSNWPTNATVYKYTPNLLNVDAKPHTMCVDNTHLYIGFGTSLSMASHDVHKVLKSDMTFVGRSMVPKMTDDMCQTQTHLFIGIELLWPDDPSSYGYRWGACAIRKSDMQVTALPLLHSTDVSKSYASLIFGNYLIDLKTNGYIYAIDISDVDNWSASEPVGKRTLKAYNMYKPGGTIRFNASPINEALLTESGLFIGFAWAEPSLSVSYNLTGLNYFAAPTVSTGNSAIINNEYASLSGSILNNGGKTISECGIILGHEQDLSDGITFPASVISNDFELAINNISFGTYYWRSYAVNPEGTGLGDIESFVFENPFSEPGKPTALTCQNTINNVLSWSAPSNTGGASIVGYKIERKELGGEWSTIIESTGSISTSYTDTVPLGSYTYRVSAITTYTVGLPSDILPVSFSIGGAATTNNPVSIRGISVRNVRLIK